LRSKRPGMSPRSGREARGGISFVRADENGIQRIAAAYTEQRRDRRFLIV